ncbi:MAG: hypothetical protein QME59_05785 [Candidatus Hydrothermarchaeota archaeon]|nr:hypothetical protein [Candidatus Hydrothermarchaeota archaeon]
MKMGVTGYRVLKELELLAKARKEDITTLIAKAVEVGIGKLKTETVIEQYFKGEIDRKEAIRQIGLDTVKLAEKQKKFALEDVKWGMHGA